jgi:hypothetical protein
MYSPLYQLFRIFEKKKDEDPIFKRFMKTFVSNYIFGFCYKPLESAGLTKESEAKNRRFGQVLEQPQEHSQTGERKAQEALRRYFGGL